MIVANHLKGLGYHPRGIAHAGAHEAQEMADYVELGPQMIVWVEGDPDTFKKLDAIVAAARGPPVQLAICALLGARDGEALEFNVFSNEGASSSIFRATPRLREEWPHVFETGLRRQLTCSRLDTALAGRGVEPQDIDVLVFDLQGAEILAMDGAGAFLDSAKFVEVEVSQEAIYDGGPLASDVDNYLVSRGFRPITPIPWHGDVVYQKVPIDS